MYKYKNRTDRDLSVVGVGVVKAGAEFEHETLLENPNFELLSAPEGKAPATASPDAQPDTPAAPAPDNDDEEGISE